MMIMISGNDSPAEDLKVGDNAPDFSMAGSDGKTYKLSDFKGKRWVVVAWFPKAFTCGWTAECKSLRESGAELKKIDVAHFAESCDSLETNTNFAKKLDLNYPILSDPEGVAAKAYGIYNASRKFPNRVTFFISKDGKIAHIEKKVSVRSHGDDVLAKLIELSK